MAKKKFDVKVAVKYSFTFESEHDENSVELREELEEHWQNIMGMGLEGQYYQGDDDIEASEA